MVGLVSLGRIKVFQMYFQRPTRVIGVYDFGQNPIFFFHLKDALKQN